MRIRILISCVLAVIAGGVLAAQSQRAPAVAAADAFGNTPLHKAVEAGNLAEVERLLAAGANVNTTNRFRTTPLATAARPT